MNGKRQKEPPLEAKRVRVPLRTPQEVARFMARCIRSSVRGDGENANYKLCMMASMLSKVLEGAELERRVQHVERKLNLR